jgi:hypothetical protein
MIPIPIPDDTPLDPQLQRRLVIGPPDGDPTGHIRPVEAIVEVINNGDSRYVYIRVLIEIEEADWKLWGIKAPPSRARFWLSQATQQMVPFALITEPTTQKAAPQ